MLESAETNSVSSFEDTVSSDSGVGSVGLVSVVDSLAVALSG